MNPAYFRVVVRLPTSLMCTAQTAAGKRRESEQKHRHCRRQRISHMQHLADIVRPH